MIYNLKRDNYSNFSIFEQNKLDPRAYFVPFGREELANKFSPTEARYNSDKIVCLNGNWDFKYYPKVAMLPSDFNTDTVEFDTVSVPSCWQFTGYEEPFYVNQKYQFRCKPPLIPTDKPVGRYFDVLNGKLKINKVYDAYNSAAVYRRYIDIKSLNLQYIIAFLGAAGSLELYVNGSYVGYSEGAHNTAEFDINSYLHLGENEIVVVVHKWCNGSYLEAQDMFRNNGIFRDVLLYVSEPTFIYDYRFFATKTADKYNAVLSIAVNNNQSSIISAKLSFNGRIIASETITASDDNKINFNGLNVTEWNAEIPTLYDLHITLTVAGKVTECIRQKIGFKTISISNRVFCINGAPVKLKGVNHHDSSPINGYYLTPEDILRDILVMKDFNVNCVRTSHYPPDPMFIELCNIYGIYVVDEADIETHGTGVVPYRPNLISNNMDWKNHYWDRVNRMFMRDRNNASVIMWSLGNEAGGIKCHDYCYDLLKKLAPNTPIHYEGAIRSNSRVAYDVVSMMYASVSEMEKIAKRITKTKGLRQDAYNTKPFYLCEYAHAMGVGPGSLEDYWQTIYANDNCMGGCIWEFVDHAVYDENAKNKWTYGGDHNEYVHDSNFCVDGLFFPDRTPHTGALAMRAVYRPLRAQFVDKHHVELKNTNSFRNTKYINAYGNIIKDGKILARFDLDTDIDAGCIAVSDLGIEEISGDSFINIIYMEGEKLIAREQLILQEHMPIIANLDVELNIKYTQINNILNVEFFKGFVRFDINSGALINYSYDGVEYLNVSPQKNSPLGKLTNNIYRAPIDNDMYIKNAWHKFEYDKLQTVLESFEFEPQGQRIIITQKSKLNNSKNKTLFLVQDKFEINSSGVIDVTTVLSPLVSKLPILPRVGKVLELNSKFQNIIYYGRGDGENYPDLLEQSIIGVYHTQVSDLLQPYIKPQESGNRCDVRYALISNAKGNGIMIVAEEKPFNFNAKNIADTTLAKCAHLEDVVNQDAVFVNIDGFMGGVGSGSCGPTPLEKYILSSANQYKTTFKLIPFSSVESCKFNIK